MLLFAPCSSSVQPSMKQGSKTSGFPQQLLTDFDTSEVFMMTLARFSWAGGLLEAVGGCD